MKDEQFEAMLAQGWPKVLLSLEATWGKHLRSALREVADAAYELGTQEERARVAYKRKRLLDNGFGGSPLR